MIKELYVFAFQFLLYQQSISLIIVLLYTKQQSNHFLITCYITYKTNHYIESDSSFFFHENHNKTNA